jgi:hypothetical protein
MLILLSFGSPSTSFADNANPPKLESVTQMTQGPYKPGDLIQFELKISGGAPQLSDSGITGSSDCFINPGNPNPPQGSQFDPKYWSITIRTFIISSACPNGVNNIQSITVSDVTGLNDLVVWSANNKPSSWQFEVANKYRQPRGVVQPIFDVSQDKVILSKFSNAGSDRTTVNKISLNAGSIAIELPKLTELGLVIRWEAGSNSSGCRFIEQRFPGDTKLFEFFSKGRCSLTARAWQPNGLLTNVNGQSYVYTAQGNYNFEINSAVSNSKVSITCTKGKTIKKVSGTNPKCPKGYKKAG